jgi:glycosyltransferase involved in cell wall biosynthesis
MRILFLTQLLPLPLDAGPKVRSFHVLRYLSQAGHDVHLVSFIRPGEHEHVVDPLRRLCASIDLVPLRRSRLRDARDGVRSLLTSMPFLVLRDQVAPMHERLEQLAGSRSFDAIHADQLWMAPYGMNGVGAGLRVLDQHNAVYLVPQRMAQHHANPVARALLRSEACKLAAFERDACRRYDRVVWVTDEDRRAIVDPTEDRAGRDTVIPIATDPDMHPRIRRDRPFRVTFLGGLHWPPNSEGVSWFVEHCWARVAEAVPSAVLTIIGKGGEKAVPGLDGSDRVEITGYVNDPLRYLSETAVFVVPLLSGAGMRVKILDAWCWGLPIVSTTIGAEGLQAVDGDNLLLADEPETFADSVIRIMRNEVMARRLVDNGRATVETSYDWKAVYRAWDGVYSS